MSACLCVHERTAEETEDISVAPGSSTLTSLRIEPPHVLLPEWMMSSGRLLRTLDGARC